MKLKTCKWCKQKFEPSRPTKICCSPDCEYDYGLKHAARAEHIRGLEDRKTVKLKLAAIKTRAQWLKEAQTAFNKFIRARDQIAGHTCISSGRILDWSGNQVDAGHYRSTGSAPHLRFDERNCHAQSKQDNRFLSGNAVDYRIGLIARIGLQEVESLEADQEPRRYSIDELRLIKAKYAAMTKELKNGR